MFLVTVAFVLVVGTFTVIETDKTRSDFKRFIVYLRGHFLCLAHYFKQLIVCDSFFSFETSLYVAGSVTFTFSFLNNL